jgi:hypothetical protein
MSTYPVVSAVSATLRNLLRRHLADSGDPALSTVEVLLGSPRALRDEDTGVSLWMYRVTRNEFLLHHPPPPPAEGAFAHHALPIDLHFLVTPLAEDPGDEQDLMGRILQTFTDHAVVRGTDLADELSDSGHELRVTLDTLSLEDLTRIWNALQEPYSLSVPYQVSVVAIDSAHEPRAGRRVQRVESTYAQIVGRR